MVVETTNTAAPTLRQEPEHVRYARENAGYKQVDAARALGISPQLLSDIEKGRRSASAEVLNRMSSVYRIPRGMIERDRWTK
jgi:transcriptional regulator with XRE-family HTH domain